MVRALVLLMMAIAALVTTVNSASAHSLRVAFVQVRAHDDTSATLVLKTPAVQGGTPALAVSLPDRCRREVELPARRLEDGVVEQWDIRCEPALDGATARVEGLGGPVREAIVSVEGADGSMTSTVVSVSAPRFTIGMSDGAGSPAAPAYLGLGVEHILFGVDHLLFVVGLLLVVWCRGRGERRLAGPLLSTITAFTVAHSVTLALATLGHARLPGAPVELTIALSILLLAVEVARSGERADTLTFRYPWAVAFAFGLLHGFGFAGALAEVGLPSGSAVAALFWFNLGVELGQLAFVAAMLLPLWLANRLIAGMRAAGGTPGLLTPASRLGRGLRLAVSYGIGTAAAYWCIERAAALW